MYSKQRRRLRSLYMVVSDPVQGGIIDDKEEEIVARLDTEIRRVAGMCDTMRLESLLTTLGRIQRRSPTLRWRWKT